MATRAQDRETSFIATDVQALDVRTGPCQSVQHIPMVVGSSPKLDIRY